MVFAQGHGWGVTACTFLYDTITTFLPIMLALFCERSATVVSGRVRNPNNSDQSDSDAKLSSEPWVIHQLKVRMQIFGKFRTTHGVRKRHSRPIGLALFFFDGLHLKLTSKKGTLYYNKNEIRPFLATYSVPKLTQFENCSCTTVSLSTTVYSKIQFQEFLFRNV